MSAPPPTGTPRAEVRVINSRPVIFWPCAFCKIGLNTGQENVGLTIECPACRKPVLVPNPNANGAWPGSLPLNGDGLASSGDTGKSAGRRRFIRRAAILAVAILVLVGGAAALLVWRPWARKAELTEDDIKFLPDGCQLVAALDVQGLRASKTYDKFKGKYEETTGASIAELEAALTKRLGLGPADIKKVLLGGEFSKLPPDFTVVVKTSKALRAEDLVHKLGGQDFFDEVKSGPYRMYTSTREELKTVGGEYLPDSFAVVNNTTVVIGPATSVRKVLKRNREPRFSPSLQEALKHTRFSRTFVLAVGKVPDSLRTILKNMASMNLEDEVSKKLSMALEWLNGLKGGNLEIQVGSSFDVKVRGIFKDARVAENTKKTVALFVDGVKSFRVVSSDWVAILDSLKAEARGDTVTWTLTVDADKAIKLAEKHLAK
jgi:hypothetical protein